MEVQRFLSAKRDLEINEPVGDRPICVVDSSFNPPNLAHAKLAHIGLQAVPNSVVLFLLATGNADKPTAAPQQLNTRLVLMRLLGESFDPSGNNVRLGLTTAPFFIDKAAALRKEYKHNRLVFMVGYDTFVRFVNPKYYKQPITQVLDEFFALAEMLVLTRNDETTNNLVSSSLEQQLNSGANLVGEKHRDRVHFVLSGQDTVDISSTRARESPESLRECCPSNVAEYALAHNLYFEPN